MNTNILRQCEALEGLADVPSSSIPLVVTSPPWGKARIYGGHQFDFEPVAAELWRVIEPGGIVCWHHQDQIEDGSESSNIATNFCISVGWDSVSTRH